MLQRHGDAALARLHEVGDRASGDDIFSRGIAGSNHEVYIGTVAVWREVFGGNGVSSLGSRVRCGLNDVARGYGTYTLVYLRSFLSLTSSTCPGVSSTCLP